MTRDKTTRVDISNAAEMILAFIAGSSLEAFQDDEKTRSAVLYQLLVLVRQQNASLASSEMRILALSGLQLLGCVTT